MSHIFISYSKQNIDFARHLRSLLQAEGFAVWMDESRLVPSEKWWPTIEQNILTCTAFIIIMSPESRASIWVEREILLAEEEKKPIFPVLYADRRWSRLAEIQYEDMSADPAGGLSVRFVEGLKRYVPTNHAAAPPPLPGELVSDTKPPFELIAPPRKFPLLAALLSAAGGFVLLALVMVLSRGGGGLPDITATLNAILADFSTQTAVAQAMLPSDTPPPATSTPTDDLTSTAQAQMTLDAQATARAPTNTPQPSETPIPTATVDVGATRTATAAVAAAATQARLDALATIRVENAAIFATQAQEANVNLTLTGAAAVHSTAVFATLQAQQLAETAASPIIFADNFTQNRVQAVTGSDAFTSEYVELGKLHLGVRRAGHYTLYSFTGVSENNFYAAAKVRVSEQSREGCVGYYVGSIGADLYYLVMLCRDDFQFFARLTKYQNGQFTMIVNRNLLSGWTENAEFELGLEAEGGVYKLELNGEVIATTVFNPVRHQLGFVVSNECCDSDVMAAKIDEVVVRNEK